MRHTTDTLPERGVLAHHFLRSREQWYGVLINIPIADKRQSIKSGLDAILEEAEATLSFEREGLIHAKGTYSPATLNKLRQYVRSMENAMIIKGTYEDLLGTYWVEENKRKVGYTN